jgi:hypothetical protein
VIGRAQIAHQNASLGALELAVMARDGVVGQHQIIVLALTDAQLLSHFDSLAASAAGQDDDQ